MTTPTNYLTYEVILSELGENLIKATSGREALEQLLKNDIAVVLLDVSMPIQDGFELANVIRQHPRFDHSRAILFVSRYHLGIREFGRSGAERKSTLSF